jgi:cytoskeletal protein RodZ
LTAASEFGIASMFFSPLSQEIAQQQAYLSLSATRYSRRVRESAKKEKEKGTKKRKSARFFLSAVVVVVVVVVVVNAFSFVKREKESTKHKNLEKRSRARREQAGETPPSLARSTKMDDAKENHVASPGKPSWPLPSPSSTGGSGGGVAGRKRPSAAAAAALLGDDEKGSADKAETIPTNRRRAVDVLAHMATTAAVRDLAAALEHLAVSGTAEEAKRAAERALAGEKREEKR